MICNLLSAWRIWTCRLTCIKRHALSSTLIINDDQNFSDLTCYSLDLKILQIYRTSQKTQSARTWRSCTGERRRAEQKIVRVVQAREDLRMGSPLRLTSLLTPRSWNFQRTTLKRYQSCGILYWLKYLEKRISISQISLFNLTYIIGFHM